MNQAKINIGQIHDVYPRCSCKQTSLGYLNADKLLFICPSCEGITSALRDVYAVQGSTYTREFNHKINVMEA